MNMDINPVEIQKFLGGVDYPARRDELVDKARQNGAPEDVINVLENIGDEEFRTPADVSKALS